MDELDDFGAELDAETENEEKVFEDRAEERAAPAKKRVPAKKRAAKKQAAPQKEADDLELIELGNSLDEATRKLEEEESGQTPKKEKEEDGGEEIPEIDEEKELAEPDEDGEEETDDEEEEEAKGPIDYDAELKKISKLKTGELRKAVLRERMGRKKAEKEFQEARAQVNQAKREAEEARNEFLGKVTDVDPPKLEDHEPYKAISKEYSEWEARNARKIKNSSVRKKLAENKDQLRARAAAIESLPEDRYDQAREELEDYISKEFPDHSETVLALVDDAADYEIRAAEIRRKFSADAEENRTDYARKTYESRMEALDKSLTGIYAVTPEQEKENPFTVEAAVARLLKDKESGSRAEAIARSDFEKIAETVMGPKPLKIDPMWSPEEIAEARQDHYERAEKAKEVREERLPALVSKGLWAMRLFQMQAKRIAELEKLAGKVAPAPVPGGNKKPKRSKAPQTEEELEAELNRSLAGLGE